MKKAFIKHNLTRHRVVDPISDDTSLEPMLSLAGAGADGSQTGAVFWPKFRS
jgi:hypothetical protein